MDKAHLAMAGVAALIYVLFRIVEAVLNMWNKNPLTWAESKARQLAASVASTSSGATSGVSSGAVASPAGGAV